MTTYYMISESNSSTSRWEPCRAKTLTGAKREATARFGGGFRDETISVGAGESIGRVNLLASKANNGYSKWVSHD